MVSFPVSTDWENSSTERPGCTKALLPGTAGEVGCRPIRLRPLEVLLVPVWETDKVTDQQGFHMDDGALLTTNTLGPAQREGIPGIPSPAFKLLFLNIRLYLEGRATEVGKTERKLFFLLHRAGPGQSQMRSSSLVSHGAAGAHALGQPSRVPPGMPHCSCRFDPTPQGSPTRTFFFSEVLAELTSKLISRNHTKTGSVSLFPKLYTPGKKSVCCMGTPSPVLKSRRQQAPPSTCFRAFSLCGLGHCT